MSAADPECFPLQLRITTLRVEKLGRRPRKRVSGGPSQGCPDLAKALRGAWNGPKAGGEDFFNTLDHYAKNLCAKTPRLSCRRDCGRHHPSGTAHPSVGGLF